MNSYIKVLGIMVLLFFICFGILFCIVLTEEVFHFFDLKGKAICLNSDLYIEDNIQEGYLIAFTVLDMAKFDNVKDYEEQRSTSEKYANVMFVIEVELISMLIGVVICWLFTK